METEKLGKEAASSTSSEHEPTAQQPPPQSRRVIPDGGLEAWCQVLGSFLLFINFGIMNSFGVFQTYYGTTLASEATASDVSWIGSLQAALPFFVGLFTGPLFDWGYLRSMLSTGTFCMVFGMMMASICTRYWQLLLAQGVLVGIGVGCIFLPGLAILPIYFRKRKALAVGVSISGAPIGGIVYTVIFRQLQPTVGFGWATRTIAFVMLITQSVSIFLMRMPVKPASRRRLFDAAAWREKPYTLFNVGFFFGVMGIYVPFFYLPSYALEHGVEATLAFYLLLVLNAASFFGRILPNFLADRTGVFNMLIPSSLVAALLSYLWVGIDTTPGLAVFAVLYGFFSGTFLSLPPSACVALSPTVDVVGVRLGMNIFVASIGLAIGNPIAGAVLRHGWASLQIYAASCIALAAIFMTFARVSAVGWSVLRKF